MNRLEELALMLARSNGHSKPEEIAKAFLKQGSTYDSFVYTPKGNVFHRPTKVFISQWADEVCARPDMADFWFVKDTLCTNHAHNFQHLLSGISPEEIECHLYTMFYALKTGKKAHMKELLSQCIKDWCQFRKNVKVIHVGQSHLIMQGKGNYE